MFADFIKIFGGFSKFNKNWILLEASFWNFWGPTQNLEMIGFAILTFIEYKQTDKQSIYW